MDLNVVIICCDDPHVFATLDSIDIDIPVIVSLVPNWDLEERLRARGVEVRVSIRGNYSVSANRGLEAVQAGGALIVDSDCTLAPGCLTRVSELLDEAPIARARVHYESSPKIRFSRAIARMRNQMVNERTPIPAYTPGLGLRMDIAPALGGYFFDDRVFWASDSEFSHRVYDAGLKVAYSPEAVIIHQPVSFSYELYSSYRLGRGTRVQVELGLCPPYQNPDWLARRVLGWLIKHLTGRSLKRQQLHTNLSDRLIHWSWRMAFYIGYYSVFFRRPDNVCVE